jgi:hypothetical protein
VPLTVPTIDGRTYDELRDEALRRIPVHNPAWTNFNASDPGVTLIELFAFMTENLLYRSNQIPERNRRKFLSLLGVPLQSASSAHGIVTIANERGPLETLTLGRGVEVRAGQVPFRTDLGLDVLPVEYRVYAKRRAETDQSVKDQYRALYAALALPGQTVADVDLYRTAVVTVDDGGIDLIRDTVDGSLWIALFARPADKPAETGVTRARAAIAGKTLSLGIVPIVTEGLARLGPGAADATSRNHLRYRLPSPPPGGIFPTGAGRLASYRDLDASEPANVLVEPGIVQLSLPGVEGLGLWQDLEPLESGAGDFPPPIEDSAAAARLVTWIRIQATSAQPTAILWAGINATPVTQRVPIVDESLPDGTGDPDQVVHLARRPVLPGSVRLVVTTPDATETWTEIEDLSIGGPEVNLPDPAAPPGLTSRRTRLESKVFALDPEAGELRFGDGERGRRPPRGAIMRATYDVSDGTAGDVGPGAISSGPTLPPGVKVANPVRTWGGVDAESVIAGEKRIALTLKHGERLVTAEDHRAIAAATPGVEVGRVDVLPAFDPRMAPGAPGDSPGAVTLMVIPRFDQARPDAPLPDKFFLDAICRHLDSRRLVTSELFLRGPSYVPVWVSLGIEVVGDRSIAETREAVRRAVLAFLSPLPAAGSSADPALSVPPFAHSGSGWPLRYPVRKLELETFVGRVDGVLFVRALRLAGEDGAEVADRIELTSLSLPRLVGLAVTVGDPVPIAQIQGTPTLPAPAAFPVPIPPEEC